MRPGQKPRHVAATERGGGGRQAMWSAIRAMGVFTVPDAAAKAKVELTAMRNFANALERGGFVVVIGRQARDGTIVDLSGSAKLARVYRLVRDIGVERPMLSADGSASLWGAGSEQMWRTMKRINVFSCQDLALAASTEARVVALRHAQNYIHYLVRAGYLAVVVGGKPGQRSLYRFLRTRDSGPKAPQIQKDRSVWDPNLSKVVHVSPARAAGTGQ